MPDTPVSTLIQSGPVDHVTEDQKVLDAIRYMAKVKRGAVPVITDGRLVGMFSERDLMLRVVLANKNPADTRVGDVMTRDLVIARVTDSVRDCLLKMKKMHFRHLPIEDEGQLVGLLSLRDLMDMEAEQKDEAIQMLNYYVGFRPEQGG